MCEYRQISTMNSSKAPKDSPNNPLYFFDQPFKWSQIERTRHILYFTANKEGSQFSRPQNGNKEDGSEQLCARPAGEPGEADTSAPVGAVLEFQDRGVLDLYRREAPLLLNELSLLLSQHKGRFPQGIVNILDCTWEDLTAGALVRKTLEPAGFQGPPRSVISTPARKPPVSSDAPKKHVSNQEPPKSATFSLSQSSLKHPGLIIQPPSDEPNWIRLSQRVMEVLQVARNPEKIQATPEDLKEYVTCRYYDEKAEVMDRNGRMTKPEAPLREKRWKFHYKFKDGSSFIYYPSGRVAVCQSSSGPHCGGFYTNVFSDRDCPVILATVTPFGHGSVTHLSSSAISAVWDQEGGFMCDQHGVMTKEWRWLTGLTQMEKIVVPVSDQISVRLLSGSSATLSFRGNGLRADVLLPVVTGRHQPTRTGIKTTAGGLKPKHRSTAVEPKRKKEVLQEVKDVQEPEQLEQWRQGCHAARKVQRLQQRIRNISEDWLDYYRRATGIMCPNLIRTPDAQLRDQVRRAVQSAEPPSPSPPEHADIKPVHPGEDRGLSRPEIMPGSPVLQPSAVPLLFKSSPSSTACPALLRAALRGEGGHGRCCCGATAMPVVTDLEYDALIMGHPPQSHQILVVCVTPPCQPVSTCSEFGLDVLDQLYRRMNSHRAAPCTQCQLDSFRLVRYQMPPGMLNWGLENWLLHRRHKAAPGMFLMYIRGKLLFLGFLPGDHSCTEKDLLKEISRVRGDYRSGLSLPSDYKHSDTANTSAATDADSSNTTTGSAPGTKAPCAFNVLHPATTQTPTGP